MDFDAYLNIIKKRFEKNFDLIDNYNIDDYKFDLFAKYNFRLEKYVLTKKMVVYALENNEYCLIKTFDALDKYDFNRYINTLVKAIDILVNPTQEHMSSIITGVIVVKNKPSNYVINTVKKFKYHKGFLFGFRGWVDIRLILVAIDDEYIVTNKKGKEVKEVYSL
ncbi:hypothetical protein EDD65_104136 [Keratinibaculum paraultunense]|uniref:DUF8052 domain-containing protein n=1 Tax=Keratinibaculum paraultunense TaxID=1278232 RepID=A0A4V2UUF6_9FIRM|nr:hypothetical protein [Keratinibaculum paraultunense]QQY78973.1 hypothetical protein JL105_07185 [Keratinibaculum paraultunense]TCS90593.1 hypothetical protein EDD65_104136 [Keratinibaculum paraultunense]